MTYRILGVDPGLRVTGYGVIDISSDRPRLVEAGVVTPNVRGTLEERLRELHEGISAVVSATQPQAMVIEELYTTYKNPLTAIMMGHARGVLCLAGAQHSVPVHKLAHSLVKRALIGSGAARKDQVNQMVTHLLGLRRRPQPNDVSDALALAIAFANMRDHSNVRNVILSLGPDPTAGSSNDPEQIERRSSSGLEGLLRRSSSR